MQDDGIEQAFERDCTAAWAQDHLHLIVMPTEKCNFRCVYCYEDFAIGRMKRPVIDGVKALIRRRVASLSPLEIQWFGGEPTLAHDIVCEVMNDAQEVACATVFTAWRNDHQRTACSTLKRIIGSAPAAKSATIRFRSTGRRSAPHTRPGEWAGRL
jgi:molybdenum cofactor biosynthesis enzyme MoaA